MKTYKYLLGFFLSTVSFLTVPVFAIQLNSGNIALAPFNCQLSDTSCSLSRGITDIAVDTFSGYTNLDELLLEANQLSTIQPGAFNGLTNLTMLDLRDNGITSLTPGMFDGLPNVNNLLLDNNNITTISSGYFTTTLPSLTTLSLMNNGITSLIPGMFVGPSLHLITLDNNNITTFSSNVFNTSITNLSLANNQITTITPNMFTGLSNLEILQLSYNQIDTILSGSFASLQNIVHLDLTANKLVTIPIGLFNGLPSLYTLHLSHNCFDSTNTGLITYFSGLYSSLNPIVPSIGVQEVCLQTNYNPSSLTSGSVVGTLQFIGGSLTDRNQLQSDNPTMPSYTWVNNGLYTFPISLLNDAGNRLWHNYVGIPVITGTVTRIDNIPPVVTLSGPSTQYVAYGDIFVDLGASRTDNISGPGVIPYGIPSGIPINTSISGPYYLTYTATDAAGNTTSIMRTVVVQNQKFGGGGGIDFGGDVVNTLPNILQGIPLEDTILSSNEGKADGGLENTNGTISDSFSSQPVIFKESDLYNQTIQPGYCYQIQNTPAIYPAQNIVVSDEFTRGLALFYAYDISKTNKVSEFDSAKPITRVEAAKLFSLFAQRVLCRTPDRTLQIKYTDINNLNIQDRYYVALAYQLGLMKGDKNNTFRPKDNMTLDEFNTVLIRMLLNGYFDEDEKFWSREYNNVINMLGILPNNAISDINNTSFTVLLYRAYKKSSFTLDSVDGNDSFVLENRSTFLK